MQPAAADRIAWSPAAQHALRAKLARSGHSSVLAGECIVVVGGILRDTCLEMDVLVVRLHNMSVTRRVQRLPPATSQELPSPSTA